MHEAVAVVVTVVGHEVVMKSGPEGKPTVGAQRAGSQNRRDTSLVTHVVCTNDTAAVPAVQVAAGTGDAAVPI